MSWLSRVVDIMRSRDRVGAARLVADGVRLAREDRIQEALQRYRKASKADRGYALAHLNIGLALQDLYNRERADLTTEMRNQRLDAMAASFDLAIALDAELAPAYSARGYVLRALQRDPEACENFAHFLQLADDKDKLRQDVERDLQALQKKIAQQRLREEMIERVREDDCSPEALIEALDFLRQAVEHKADDVELWWALGVGLRRSQDMAGAKAAFSRCLELDPDRVAAHRELSSLAFKEKRFAEALNFAEQAYRLNPTEAAIVCNVGVCHLELGDALKAREYIELAAELDADDAIVQNCLRALEDASVAD